MPKVSIIIPIYNSEKYLKRCLDSVLNQSYEDFEVICVDDGSQDSSGVICDAYAEKDRRVRTVHIPNGGVSSARNAGLGIARGEYVMFVDSDDWVGPEYVCSLLPVDGEELVYAGYVRMMNGVISEEVFCKPNTITKETWIRDFKTFWERSALHAVWRGCYRSEIIRNNNVQFVNGLALAEDVLFNLDYLACCKMIRLTNDSNYYYECAEVASAMGKYRENRLAIEIEVCRKIEQVSQSQQLAIRWLNWHVVIRHLRKWEKCGGSKLRAEIHRKLYECYKEPYFRECIPYVRRNGTLDERIETYFMSRVLHPLYQPFYKFIVFVSKIKRKITGRKGNCKQC